MHQMFDALFQELAQEGSVRFYVRARPDAPVTRVTAVLDDESVKVDIAAPAEKGKANKEKLKDGPNKIQPGMKLVIP